MAARPWEGEGLLRHRAFPHPSHPFGMSPFVDPLCGSTPQAGEGAHNQRAPGSVAAPTPLRNFVSRCSPDVTGAYFGGLPGPVQLGRQAMTAS